MAEGSAPVVKVCAGCLKDVSRLPRTKDSKGRYLCQECLAKSRASQAAAKPKVMPAAKPKAAVAVPNDSDVLGRLLADSPGVELCPNCSGGMTVGSKICMRCGFNKETGKATQVHVELAPKEKAEPSAASKSFTAAYRAMADTPMGWLFAAGGALIGGVIGAAAYSWVMISSGYEVYLIAVLIGMLAGAGGLLSVRWSASTSHGVIAAMVALACIIGGRYFAVEQFASEVVGKMTQDVKVEEENIIAMVGRDVARDFSSQGKNYQWPEESDPTTATEEAEFPVPIWTEAKARYERMDDTARHEKRLQAEAELKIAIAEFKSEATDVIFKESLNQRSTGFRRRSGWGSYIKWGLVGVCVAFAIGSGFNNPFND